MGALNKLYNTLNLFHEPMHRLTCDIEINTADGLIRRDHAQSVTIAKHSEQLCDVATVALPRRIHWRNVANTAADFEAAIAAGA